MINKFFLTLLGLSFIVSQGYCMDLSNENFKGYASYRGDKGIGFTSSLKSLDLMCFFKNCEESVAFADVRGHWLRQNQYALNLGLGMRKKWDEDSIWGANLYYDHRKTRYHHYHQLSFGGEYFHDCWELRMNGYFALDSKVRSNRSYSYPNGLIYRSHLKEYPFSHAQLEIGRHLSLFSFSPYLGIGTYYIKSRYKGQGLGSIVRLRETFYEYFTIELSGTYDRVFKGIFQAALTIEFPWRQGIPCNMQSNACRDVMHERVYRDDIIPIKRSCHWTTNQGLL
ncbi:hypothetical protein PHSC3_000651 [Chlamydiales bacterium STE3]|nr:hypothetical protein PHSC3_000651 [Chlamydiales bacterium STE3]